MRSFSENMTEYKKQMEKGVIQDAYQGLMEYLMGLRNYLKNKYPEHTVSGSLYYGHMDMTYFSFTSGPIKKRDLKIAIIFVHKTLQFEVWLVGVNKQVQKKIWNSIKDSGWNKYHRVPSLTGEVAIIEHVLVADPDFSDLEALTDKIEQATLKFSREVESFLQGH